VEQELLTSSPGVTWDSIVGLVNVKRMLHEIVILPGKRPDIFTGLRAPPKGAPGQAAAQVSKIWQSGS
jgi:SpoVK/Ycf46/Vps4 family AAA+-type ATPase